MRKILNSGVTKFVGAFMCLVLVAASADARLERYSTYIYYLLPGITSNGNLDSLNRGDASVKATYNTKEERAYVQARGTVQNRSRRSFHAEDTYVGWNVFGFTVVSDKYSVSSRGSAYLVARAYILD